MAPYTPQTKVAEYQGLPVYSDFSKPKAKRIMASRPFVTCADEALSNVREWWKVQPVGLVLEEVGVSAMTRSGDHLLVRY